RHRASGLPRSPGARRLRAPPDPARLHVLTGAARVGIESEHLKEGSMSAPTHHADTPLLVDVADGIATVTLNRPGQFNALSNALIGELQSTLDRIAVDRGVRVVVLAASGRGFCAGHDLKEIRAMAAVEEVEALFA